MKFKIHYTIGDYEDCIVIERDTIEEITKIAREQVKKRGATNAWSEEIN